MESQLPILKNPLEQNPFISFFIFQAREGFTNLTGVDYSPHAINLAKAVAEKQALNINYEVRERMWEAFIFTLIHPDIICIIASKNASLLRLDPSVPINRAT